MSSRSITRLLGPSLSLSGILGTIATLRATRRQRQALARLDASALDDIGITQEQAHIEACRPIWDVTPSWRD
ncbi:MAG: DUF1127 domain-containing protein [Rhodobacterales bacterium]